MVSMKNGEQIKAPSKILREAHQQTGAGIHGRIEKGRSKTDNRSRQTVTAALRDYR